ncbi:MAG TPA: hypothetical protein VFN40_03190 [Gemmatimonadales bacterium]|jgi:hypothetical protein|nr:hypothetical protein [Gemmatimonadales bacterium]
MTQGSPAPKGDPPTIPLGQRLFDNVFLLLIAGIVVMAVLYTGWGLWEVLTLPAAKLP